MKNILILVGFLFFLVGCSNPGDCIESTGDIITKEFSVTNFDKIIVYEGIGLVVTQGPEFKVEVKTGKNLMEGIEVKVTDSLLSLKDNITCNLVRDYGQTTVYVTAPNIIELHSKTARTITSNGILSYPILRLFSMDLTDGIGTGDFDIQVNNEQTVVESNNIARYYISGQTNDLQLYFHDGSGRFEGGSLTAKSINIFHRSSNDLVVKPTESITGKMVSTGNVILKNTPPIVDVQQLYTGHVIYN
ncbi:head GIN domain-containing protein [Flavobacterium sp.]|uniref:head GIN domain-containing protein n=1 Tax=Flavobacterium sp. TaxID=239 RepID=UPI002B4AE40A|nr:head GIN domain-containing protein [Flavobacterium sp.]HLF52946.1 head GIN domain-containing protein [Flavobacterium sp.]